MSSLAQLLLLSLLALGVASQGHHVARSQQVAEEVDWNEVTDSILAQFREQMLEQDMDVVPIPDLHESLERKFGWVFKRTVVFNATGGRLGSIASIHRIADVMVSDSGNMTFTALLKFDNLKIDYDHYTFRVAGIGPRGSLSARVMDNSALLRVHLQVNRNGCSLLHEDVEEVTLGGIKVKVSGLGPFNSLASRIATYIAKTLQYDVKDALRSLLDKELGSILRNTVLDCGS